MANKVLISFVLLSWLSLAAGVEVEVVGHLPTRGGFGASVYAGGDSVFILGGLIAVGSHTTDVVEFNLSSHAITTVGNFPAGIGLGAAGSDGKGTFFHLGGWVDQSASASVYRFTLANPTPVEALRLPHPMHYHSAASDGMGAIYIVGEQVSVREIYKYDTANGETTVVGWLPEALSSPTSTFVGDSLYIFGGRLQNGNLNKEIFKFKPATGQIEILAEKYEGGGLYASSVAVGDDLYIIAGLNEYASFRLTKFSPLTGKLEDLEVTNFSTELMAMSTVYDPRSNAIYIFGAASFDVFPVYYHNEIFRIQL